LRNGDASGDGGFRVRRRQAAAGRAVRREPETKTLLLSRSEIEAVHEEWRRSDEQLARALTHIGERNLMSAFGELRALLEADADYALAHFHFATLLLELHSLGPAVTHTVAALELGLRHGGILDHTSALLAAFEQTSPAEAAPVRQSIEPLLPTREPTLTVAMIARDEEENIARCLRSAQDVATQVVVVDTGSRDRTPDIARELGAEVAHFPWRDDFSAARNASLEYATGDWVLWLDADEELQPEGVAPLRELLRNEEVGGAHLRIDNLMGNATIPFLTTRLWRNHPTVRFKQPIHEQILWSVSPYCRRTGRRVAEAPDVCIRHYGYLPTVVAARGKSARNLHLLERLVQQEPDNDYALFHYASALRDHNRREDAAREFARWGALVAKRPAGDNQWIRLGFATYAAVLNELARHEDALATSSRAIESLGPTPSLLYHRALALHRLGRHREALADLQAANDIPRAVGPSVETVDFQPMLVPMLTADIHVALGEREQARAAFHQAIRAAPQDPGPRFSLARLCIAEDDLEGAAEHLDRVLRMEPDNAPALATLGQVEVFQHNFVRATGLLRRAAELDPRGEGVRLLGEVLLIQGRTDEAEQVWSGAPGPESVAGCLAFLRLTRGEVEEALSLLRAPNAGRDMWMLVDKVASLERKNAVPASRLVCALAGAVARDARLRPLRATLVRVFLRQRFTEGLQILRGPDR
jgi:glycosyltransferase involved in cell wall biosynthesis/predicted negative regulator of RcsB-dependent stress response